MDIQKYGIGKHKDAYRSGQMFKVEGVFVDESFAPARICVKVKYVDGKEDTVPLISFIHGDYEFLEKMP